VPSQWPPQGYESDPFEYGGIRRDVFRREAAGPPVLVFHELPGLGDSTLRVAERIGAHGDLTPVLPVLVGSAGQEAWIQNGVQICVGWEFVTFASGRTSPIVAWLRGLAARESARAGGSSVGVVGMSFSGGLALSMAVDPLVEVAITSQPALPITYRGWPGGKARDLGMSPGDLACVAGRVARGEAVVRAVRYAEDTKSPPARMTRIAAELGPGVVMTPILGSGHSVLADGATDRLAHPDAARALNEAVRLLRERLIGLPADAATPGPRRIAE
jgi:dienelactone hydrolase